MAKKTHKRPPQKKKQRMDRRRILVAVLAVVMLLAILLPLLVTSMNAGAVTQAEIDALKNDQAESRLRQQELKEQLSSVKNDQSKAQQQRAILLEQLELIQEEISNIDAQIALYDTQISEKEAERVEAVAREEAQYDLFCQRVRAMEEDGTISYWSILFNAESFSDMLDRLTIINDIMDYDNAVMDQLVATRKEIEQLKADLEGARSEQEAAREEQEVKKAEQQEKVDEAQKLLNQINADLEEVNRQLEEEDAAAKEIQAEITRKQKELEAERKKNNITIDSESSYLWPLPGYYRLTSLFGYRIHPITHQAHSHTGIDIPAPQGTAILAAKSGQVITSKKGSGSDWSYGNYVVIDHGNGNSTLYAHMDSRAVSEGDMVQQGQVIGYVGTTGSSTGNHLHYEVRVNYTRIDPESKYSTLSLTHPW